MIRLPPEHYDLFVAGMRNYVCRIYDPQKQYSPRQQSTAEPPTVEILCDIDEAKLLLEAARQALSGGGVFHRRRADFRARSLESRFLTWEVRSQRTTHIAATSDVAVAHAVQSCRVGFSSLRYRFDPRGHDQPARSSHR